MKPTITKQVAKPSKRTPEVIPASSKHVGKGEYEVNRGQLPLGSIVRARVFEGSRSTMQESYIARVVKQWPNKKTNKPKAKNVNDSTETELVALHFTDPRIYGRLPQQRKGKPPPTHYVEPNDIEECRITLKPTLIADGHVEKGTKVSARYFYHGKRVRGWDGYYPATVTEHCRDGTVLIKYMHESPKHEEYLACKDLQCAIYE